MPRTLPQPLTGRQKSRIRALAKNNTAPDIAERMEVEVSRIRRYLRIEGLSARRATHAPLDGVDLIGEVAAEQSVQVVADRYNVTRQAVYARLSRDRAAKKRRKKQ